MLSPGDIGVWREINDTDLDALLTQYGLDSVDEDESSEERPVEAAALRSSASKSPRYQTPQDSLRARMRRVNNQNAALQQQREAVAHLADRRASLAREFTAMRDRVDQFVEAPERDYAKELADSLALGGLLEEKMTQILRWEALLDEMESLSAEPHPLYHHSMLENVLELVDHSRDSGGRFKQMAREPALALMRRLDSAALLYDVAMGRCTVQTICDDQYFVFLQLCGEGGPRLIQAYVIVRRELLLCGRHY